MPGPIAAPVVIPFVGELATVGVAGASVPVLGVGTAAAGVVCSASKTCREEVAQTLVRNASVVGAALTPLLYSAAKGAGIAPPLLSNDEGNPEPGAPGPGNIPLGVAVAVALSLQTVGIRNVFAPRTIQPKKLAAPIFPGTAILSDSQKLNEEVKGEIPKRVSPSLTPLPKVPRLAGI